MKKFLRFKNLLFTLIIAITLIFLFTTSYCLYLFTRMNTVNIDRSSVINSNIDKYNDNFINLCLIGSDKYSNDEYSADSIIIFSIDKLNKKAKIISLMRDMYVRNPNTNEMFNLNQAMINGGPELLLKTINTNFNLSIDKFIETNLSLFPQIIDILDGINIDIKDQEINQVNKFIQLIDENNDTNTPYIEKSGFQLLNGTQVSAYCRLRSESGRDDVRTERQRYVLSCIFNKVKNTSILNYPSLANYLFPLIETNLKFSEVLNIALTTLKLNINTIEEIKFPLDNQYEMLITDDNAFHLSIDIENTAKEINKYIYSLE